MLKMPTLDVQSSPVDARAETKVVGEGRQRVTTARSRRCRTCPSNIPDRAVMAFIGPSGCGKSTFLRCINRMNDTIPICRVTGKIIIDNQDIYDPSLDVVQLRARVGMVFQKPNPFPKSIYENVAYGPRIHGLATRKPTSTRSCSRASRRPACGKRSRIAWTSPAPAFPAASSSACASRAPSP